MFLPIKLSCRVAFEITSLLLASIELSCNLYNFFVDESNR